MIIYHKGDLFIAPKDKTILVHACNCQGVWGSGVAKLFKQKFPLAFKDYAKQCHKYGSTVLGMGIQYHRQGEQSIGYLFTSFDYGANVDSEEKVLKNTRRSIKCLLELLPDDMQVHSPKINAGLFKVPWEKTETIILEEMAKIKATKPKVEWHVWEL